MRIRTSESEQEIRLNSLNHKINRKAMLAAEACRAYKAARTEEYFDETLRTPVGGTVSPY